MKTNILLRTLFRGSLGGGAPVALLIAAASLLAPTQQARARDVALVVGVNQYDPNYMSGNNLQGCVPDSENVETMLAQDPFHSWETVRLIDSAANKAAVRAVFHYLANPNVMETGVDAAVLLASIFSDEDVIEQFLTYLATGEDEEFGAWLEEWFIGWYKEQHPRDEETWSTWTEKTWHMMFEQWFKSVRRKGEPATIAFDSVTNLLLRAEALGPGDNLLYYHSSHGGNYSDPMRQSVLVCTFDASYSDAELAEDLLPIGEDVKILSVADTCHSGGLQPKQNTVPRPIFAAVAARLQEAKVSIANMGFIGAAPYDDYSYDGPTGGQFTSSFLAAIETEGNDKTVDLNLDRRVSAYEAWNYAFVDPSVESVPQIFNPSLCEQFHFSGGDLAVGYYEIAGPDSIVPGRTETFTLREVQGTLKRLNPDVLVETDVITGGTYTNETMNVVKVTDAVLSVSGEKVAVFPEPSFELTFALDACEVDPEEELVCSWALLDGEGEIDADTGVYTWTPEMAGEYEITVAAVVDNVDGEKVPVAVKTLTLVVLPLGSQIVNGEAFVFTVRNEVQVRDGVTWSATLGGTAAEVTAAGEITCPAGAAAGSTFKITAVPPAGAETLAQESPFVRNAPYAVEVREAMTYAEALENAVVEWAPESGDAEWYGQYAVSFDGSDALQSGFLPDGGVSAFSGKVSGIGLLTFRYRLEGSSGAEFVVTVDGAEIVRASGVVRWTSVSALMGPGDHFVSFAYTRPEGDIGEGQNRAWVDGVTLARGRHLMDMDANALGWTTGGSEDVWQRGVPTFGPIDGRICWGTILDGRYPDSVDAWLESPELAVSEPSILSFSTWFDIDNTAWKKHVPASVQNGMGDEFDDGYKTLLDSGRVEISIGNGGWTNITAAARRAGIPGNTASDVIAGTSLGWVAATIPLPDEAVGKTVRVRFRFASDAYSQGLGNPAGWFIDDVALLSADGDIALRSATVEDTASGNANGIAEPGESVWVAFTVANQGHDDRTSVVGSVRCETPGVTLTQTPAAVTYGDIAAGEAAPGAPRLLVSIADTVAPGTIVRLFQTVTDSTGETWEIESSFCVAAAAAWSGTVRQATSTASSTASAGARVTLVSATGVYTATTTTAGAFSFPAIPAGTYEITVSKDGFADYGPALVEVADGRTITVTLGVAYAVVEPESFHFDLVGTSSSADGVLFLRNGTSAKPGTRPLSFTVLFPDGQPKWLEWDILEGSVPAATADAIPEVPLRFTIRSKGLLDDPRTNATVRIASNDCDGHALQDIEITLTCVGISDAASLVSIVGCETFDDPLGTADADGYLEKGEDGFIWFSVRNDSSMALSNLVVESVQPVGGSDGSDYANVAVDTASVVSAVRRVAAYDTGFTSPALPISIPDTEELDPWYAFEVTLRDTASGLACVSTNVVSLCDRHSVSGAVYVASARIGIVSNAIVTTSVYIAPEGGALDFSIYESSNTGAIYLQGLPDPAEVTVEIVEPADPADYEDFLDDKGNYNKPKIEVETTEAAEPSVSVSVYTAGDGESLDVSQLPEPDEGYPTQETIAPEEVAGFLDGEGNPVPKIEVETSGDPAESFVTNKVTIRTLVSQGSPVQTNKVTVTEVSLGPSYDTVVTVTPFYKDINDKWTVQGVPTTYVNPETNVVGNVIRYIVGHEGGEEGGEEGGGAVSDETPLYLPADNWTTESAPGDVVTDLLQLRVIVPPYDTTKGEVLFDVSATTVERNGVFLDLEPLSEALVYGFGAYEFSETVSTETNGTYVLHGLRNGYAKVYARPSEFTLGVETGYLVTNGVAVTEIEINGDTVHFATEPVVFENLPDGLPDFEAGEGLDFFLIGTKDTAGLRLVDVAFAEACDESGNPLPGNNGNGVVESNEVFTVSGTITNVGDVPAAEVILEFAALYPSADAVAFGEPLALEDTPLGRDEAAQFETTGTNLVDGLSTILVKMTSVTSTGVTNIWWGTFDLVSMDVRFSGTVKKDGTPFGGARLLFEVLDINGEPLYTRVGQSLPETGTYMFTLGKDLDRSVRIRVQPSAEFLPENLDIDLPGPQTASRDDLDFDLVGTGFTGDGDPIFNEETGERTGALNVSLADGSADLAVTHAEGESTNLVLTIANNGNETMTVNGVSVRYVRESREYGQGVPRRRALRAAASPAEEEAENPDGQADSPDGQAVLDLSNAVPGECFVTFRNGLSAAEQNALLAPFGVTVARRYTIIRAVHCRYDAGADFLALRAALLATGGVLKVEPVYQLHLEKDAIFRDGLVDDPQADAQWALCNERQTGGSWGADINVVPLWEKGLVGSRDVVVAVMDTGFDIDHPDLIPNLWVNPGEIPGNGIDDDGNGYVDDVHGWNFALNSNDVDDPSNLDGAGHGTHCAGIIGAVGNNALGVAGVSHRVRILPVRISDDDGALTATSANVAAAFDYMVQCGADVVNCSWGHDVLFSDPILTEAIQNAANAGLLVCIAAANSAKDNDQYRLSISGLRATANVIVVAAADHDGKIAKFSNFGDELVDIAAPGVDILSTMPEELGPLWVALPASQGGPVYPVAGLYVHMSGTSMATPYVAGAAGLLKAIAPGASMQEIRRAILDGARQDPNLKDWVSTSGHLDVARAAALLGSDWLVPTTDLSAGLAIAPGATAEITFDVNPALRLMAGEYGAVVDFDYVYGEESAVFGAAVTDTVTAAPFVTVASVAIDDSANGGDGDGYAEPGEKAGLVLTLRNDGSLRLTNVSGTVSGASGSWDLLGSGGGTTSNATPIQVTMPGTEGDAEFTLELSATAPDGTSVSLSVPFTVPVARRASVTGTVKDAAGKGISGAVVEFWTGGTDAGDALPADGAGQNLAGRVVADASGAYRVDGLLPGTHVALRAIPSGYSRSAVAERNVTGSGAATANLSVGTSEIWFSNLPEGGFEETLLPGDSHRFSFSVTNISPTSVEYRAVPIIRKRVLLLSDRDSLSALAPEIANLGFDVDVLTNNYEFVNVDYGNYKFQNEEHVAYSKDPATFVNYDFVIADFDGDRQGGRQLTDEEQTALLDYLGRGGRVLVTGGSLLAMPDNDRLAFLVDAVDIRRRTAAAAADAAFADSAALPTWRLPGKGMTTFAEVASTQPSGAFLPGNGSEFDAFVLDDPSAVVLASLASIGDDGAPAVSPKILRRDVGQGALYYWGGNSGAADIAKRGVLQDVLRDILYSELFESASWISVMSDNGTFQGNGLADIAFIASADSVDCGDHAASIVFFGAFADAETVAVPVTVHVALPAFTAYTSLGVTNALGIPLTGDGQPGSCVFQLIATTSGTVSAPRAIDGMPSGGETVLISASSGLSFGRFGDDNTSDQGFFRDTFDIPLADSSLKVVVRAWSGPSVGGAIWYGDSEPYQLTREDGESHDFGRWGVGTVFNYPAADGTKPLDSNGDGIPDGYVVENFPGVDPTASPFVENAKDFIQKIQDAAVHTPYRVFATDGFVYALCENSSSQWGISVWATNGLTGTFVGAFVPTGAAVLQSPLGMGSQPGTNRLAIADTGHNAVHVFEFNESKIEQGDVQGAFTLVRTIASAESGDAAFIRPLGVAMDAQGAIYVLDSGNGSVQSGRRVVVFNADGTFRRAIQPTDEYVLVSPAGIGVDTVSGDIYVANTGAGNVVRISESGGDFDVYDGFIAGGCVFREPTDVKVWRVGSTFRLLVADRGANAVHVLDSEGKVVASFANAQDATVYRLDGNFYSPWGAYPLDDTDELWVADTQNNRLQHLRLTLDGDGDGIDDTQEMLAGSDPTVANDFDTDGDGLADSAEILLGTDPNDPDTDDGGVNDGDEVAAGLDPLDASDDASALVDLSVVALPDEGGTVSGSGSFQIGTAAEITATAAEGWLFAGWQDDGSTNSPRTVTIAPNGNAYTALFERESHLVVVNFVTTNDTPSDIVAGGSKTHTTYYGISFRQDYTPLFVTPYAFLEGSDTLAKTYAEPIVEFADGTTTNVTVTFVVDGGAELPPTPDEPVAPTITATTIAVNGATLTASFTTDATDETQYGAFMNDARDATTLVAVGSIDDLAAYRAWRAANPDAARSAYTGDVAELSAAVTATSASAPFTFSIQVDLSSWSGDSLYIIGFDKP